ncbi:MAG TPA: cadherin repeat domain-containing protein [Cellvibrionaceae bacterium]|nr:cadherin repeat domain-containing protein [Cellvibrionaceae bacterium]HMW47352.1 cadherin repeat domain-containing protein [Cellvibrionaceae bacterium]HMW70246.1 cadherin repeat domain-containing protein [Cellvibrionaceae bacterium]HNG58730.1 cadherin repeat domain-containing protein [Cellvibrionaceae bacterium]
MHSSFLSSRTKISACAHASVSSNSVIARMFKLAALFCLIALAGCDGGAIVFDAGSDGRAEVDENTSGVVWTAKATVAGTANRAKLVYELKGVDAAAFSINSTNGAISFKQPADFEMPVDADKNNEYLFSIEAKADTKSAVQQVALRVKNVTQPVVELIKPQPFENVGTGEPVEVETQVKFYDAESNTPVADGNITLNSMPMEAAGEDAKIWKSKIAVAEGGVELNIAASASTVGAINIKEKLLNKRNAANVSFPWAVQGDWMMVAGGGLDILTSFDLTSGELVEPGTGLYYPLGQFDRPSVTCHPFLLVCYGIVYGSNSADLIRINYAPAAQLQISIGQLSSPLQGNLVGLGVDAEHQRMVFVSEMLGKLNISARPLDEYGNLLGENDLFLFSLPSDTFKNGHKQFAVHGRSNAFVFTEQRSLNGVLQSFIRGFSEAGVQRFEVQLGANISNLVVHESAGLIYFAENNLGSGAQLKAIDIATGVVQNMIDEARGVPHGAFTGLALDQVNDRLYVADSISDSIYQVDLKNKSMGELPYRFIPYAKPPGIED